MKKQVLIIGYSQTGQTAKIIDAIQKPLLESNQIEIDRQYLEPEKAYPFPWDFFSFFDLFPECIFLDAPKNKPLILKKQYDLVILAYQPWFLSPSLPTTAFLKSAQATKILKDCPIITVIGCRNMWGQAHLKTLKMLKTLKASLIDNIVLIDQGSSLATFITTPRWLFTGRTNAFWGFPKAGILPSEINQATRFGFAIKQRLEQNKEKITQPILMGLGAVKADASSLQSEKIGARSFYLWGKLFRKVGKAGAWQRKPLLILYVIFLILMIISVVPITILLRKILAPLLQQKLNALETEFEQPSGSDNSKVTDFAPHE